MIWVQIFAFVVLAAHYGNGNDEPLKHDLNSFPYYHYPFGKKNDDIVVSAVVSKLSGPLCSGFHINFTAVVTAASCVFRENAKDLVVISRTIEPQGPPKLTLLQVVNKFINPRYSYSTEAHNLAVLQLKNFIRVPMLKLPVLGAPISPKGEESPLVIAKYTFDDSVSDFSTSLYPADAHGNLKLCTDEDYPINSFLCVSQANGQPFSYGLADLGTPLIYRNKYGAFLYGIFTGHHYNEYKSYFLYQNAMDNLDFLEPFENWHPPSRLH